MMSHKDMVTDPAMLTNLWKHECCRVFSDKLNVAEDKAWYDKAIQATVCAIGSMFLLGRGREEDLITSWEVVQNQ